MISQMLNKHPDILSISEFFSVLGLSTFTGERVTGDQQWKLYSNHKRIKSYLEWGHISEILYPYDDPNARFDASTLPAIMAIMVPHLTDEYEDLYDRIGDFVRVQPKMPSSDHYRALFTWLGVQFGRKLWVERHGGSLLMASRLLRHFPEARVVHVFRDGRETALSMSKHPNFRVTLALMRRGERIGLDLYQLLQKMENHDRLTCWFSKLQGLRSDVTSILDEPSNPADAAALWSRMIETGHRVFGHFSQDRLLNIRFEDIQKNPKREATRLIRFISPELQCETWINQVAKIPRQTSSRFAQLDPKIQREITEACLPGLDRLDYPV